MWEMVKTLGVLMLTISLLLSFGNQTREPKKNLALDSPDHWSISSLSTWIHPMIALEEEKATFNNPFKDPLNNNNSPFSDPSLEYDFYRDSCPQAEQIVRFMIRHFHKHRPNAAAALLRLHFHDCFIQGCDASVLLDAANGVQAEKDTPPNQTLKGFDLIEIIKMKIEQVCPATVSCADILALSAREGIVLEGGPFYPLYTGRRDSELSFPEVATYELPSPHDDLPRTLTSFGNRGFNERETVSLLGAHSIGIIHCRFFRNRLYNYAGTGGPDPSLDGGLLNVMRSKCNISRSTMDPSQEPGMLMKYEGPEESEFGTRYYNGLLHGRGILHADQQLMASEGTASWVRAYAVDNSLFQRDFAHAMMKLSNYRVLTGPLGQIRLNCSKVASAKH